MISLRFFLPKSNQYQLWQRQSGLRNLSKVQFHAAIKKEPEPGEPRVGYSRDAAFTPSSKVNVDNRDPYKAKIHSCGSQVEVDFARESKQHPRFTGEWQGTAGTKTWFVQKEPGHEVPDIFKHNRNILSNKPDNVEAYRKQLFYRAGCIGMQ